VDKKNSKRMNSFDIPARRLVTHHLANPDFKSPADVVQWFGAVQAQDYLGSLWAIGQRMKNGTEQNVEKALMDRTIIRSWPVRGTLHFVPARDIRWMLKLLTPRVFKRAASRYRELELTDDVFKKSEKILSKVLMEGKQKTREELLTILRENNISPDGQRGIHILGHLSMEGLLCFGARSGKQFTFTLLDEWIPQAKALTPEHALAEITKRYFTSHGPATLYDFIWWTGLTMNDAKEGIEMVKPFLSHETIAGKTYLFGHSQKPGNKIQKALLLPAYDEFTVAYKDRSAIIASNHFIQSGNGLRPTIVLNGQIVGTWRRELKKHKVVIVPHLFHLLTQNEHKALTSAAEQYGKFLGRTIELQ
jgi:hypothetical protein